MGMVSVDHFTLGPVFETITCIANETNSSFVKATIEGQLLLILGELSSGIEREMGQLSG